MPRTARSLGLIVVGAVALLCSSCKSNNEGKIVGKWKATSLGAEAGIPPGADVSVIFEFTADKKFTITANVNAFGRSESKVVASGNYSLGSGDWVNLTDVNPPLDGKTKSREKITISGDSMTFEDDKGKKQTLTRVK